MRAAGDPVRPAHGRHTWKNRDMATPVSNTDDVLVNCRSAWKVFGSQAPAAMRAIAERGLGKREVLQEFGCVVGVSDATLEVRRGEIFCVMGLSRSGKSTLICMLNWLIEPSGGQVFVKCKEISKLGATELRELTTLAFRGVRRDLIELGHAIGAAPRAILFKIELPSAIPTLAVGLNQCILLSLAMVVLAGLGGLGAEVRRGLARMEMGLGLRAGLAIVAVAILLDRLSRAALQRGHVPAVRD